MPGRRSDPATEPPLALPSGGAAERAPLAARVIGPWLPLAVVVGAYAIAANRGADDVVWTTAAIGVPANWEYNLPGIQAHWNKNTNPASDFDRWFLNLFPRLEAFEFNRGGYQTLSFVPSLATGSSLFSSPWP